MWRCGLRGCSTSGCCIGESAVCHRLLDGGTGLSLKTIAPCEGCYVPALISRATLD